MSRGMTIKQARNSKNIKLQLCRDEDGFGCGWRGGAAFSSPDSKLCKRCWRKKHGEDKARDAQARRAIVRDEDFVANTHGEVYRSRHGNKSNKRP